MIIIDCEQGSPEWHAARCGKVTASRVCDIVRKTKSGVSASRNTYMGELTAERLTGRVADSFKSKAMEWGNATEDQARNWYAFLNDVQPVAVGCIVHETIPMALASPDRLVGDDGLLEIKCPNTATHIATLRGEPVDPDYVKQMQWQMACSGRAWCDFVSYDPRMPEDMRYHCVRVYRDNALIAELETAVVKFIAELDASVADLLSRYRIAKAA